MAFDLIGLGCIIAGQAAWADTRAATEPDPANEAGNSLPQDSFFSSIKQSLRQGDDDVVRGHFDLGAPPNEHRYYCLVDPKTGRREPNGVLGEPVPRSDGMTGVKSSAVSLYACARAEQQGLLMSNGYVLTGRAAAKAPKASAAPAAQTSPPAPALVSASAQASAAPPAGAPPAPAAVSSPAGLSVDKIDVAGVKLGMPPDAVRAVLKSKKLRDYKEWTETLSYSDAEKGAQHAVPEGRFINVIAAWTPPAPSSGDPFEAAGEAIEVMFTPVPGKERAMAIVRSVGYSPADAVRETSLDGGLIKKYGGFVGANEIPDSPTWRYQSDGTVLMGDACNRRSILGGLGGLSVSNAPRENLALKKSSEEFHYQTERCGVAMVTEDHFTANSGAVHDDRIVTRFTVTAYSPQAASEGAEAAGQIIQAAAHGSRGSLAPRAKNERSPDL